MLEEYYTLAVIGKAGIGTPHMDGNTRLCTATAAAALKETFGTDGQPGSYTDLDHCDALFLFGHNVAETQTVLWARMLDRLRGAGPAAARVRRPPADHGGASAPSVHLAVRPGTNLALMNGLMRELIHRGWVDHDYVDAHTLGFERSRRDRSSPTPPSGSPRSAASPARDVERAAEIFGTSRARGLDRAAGLLPVAPGDGRGVPGQQPAPAARHARPPGCRHPADERPADRAEQPRDRRRRRPAGLPQLGERGARPASSPSCGTSTRIVIPHWSPPTHAMQIFRYAEQGSIGFLWIAGTNPAVSLPELRADPRILGSDPVFVWSSATRYLTETAELADVVLPAALWGEKTGTFTNVDRTVHLSEQGRRPARGGAQRPGHLGRLRAPDGLHATAAAGRSHAGTPPRRPSRRGRSARAAGPATTPA